MNFHRLAICSVLCVILIALVWDAIVLALGSNQTFCHAARELNKASNGLLALSYFALGVHIFLLQFLPQSWIR